MDAITLALRSLYQGEMSLARDLLDAARRDRARGEVLYSAGDIAVCSQEHAGRLAQAGRLHGLDLRAESAAQPVGLIEFLRRKTALALGPRPEPGLMLLHDLRCLYLAASDNSVHWEMLARAAQAAGERDLLDLASRCHPRTLRQMRWAGDMLKELSPQVLTGA